MWFIGGGRIPTLALLQISTHLGALVALQGGATAWLACWVIGLQGIVWAATLYVGARLAAAVLTRVGGGRAPLAAVCAVLLALFGMSLFDVYVASIIGRGAPVNLFGVY